MTCGIYITTIICGCNKIKYIIVAYCPIGNIYIAGNIWMFESKKRRVHCSCVQMTARKWFSSWYLTTHDLRTKSEIYSNSTCRLIILISCYTVHYYSRSYRPHRRSCCFMTCRTVNIGTGKWMKVDLMSATLNISLKTYRQEFLTVVMSQSSPKTN